MLNIYYASLVSTVTMDVFLLKSLEKQMLEHISSLFYLFYLSSTVMIIKNLTVPLMYAWC